MYKRQQKDIVVGTPILGRSKEELMNTIGMFVNTLAIKLEVDSEKIFPKFLEYVKNMCLDYFNNQEYQFEDLVENLNVKREYGRNPIFDILFSLNEEVDSQHYFNGKEIDIIEIDNNISKFDMSFIVSINRNKTYININYRSDLFKKERMEELKEYYISILEQLKANCEIRIEDIVLMSERDKELSEKLSCNEIIDEIDEFDF